MKTKNTLVFNKIESMDVDDAVKNALKDVFASEISHGNSPEVKKHKIKNCREIILKRRP